MSLHALIRDDGGPSLIVDGGLNTSEVHDGRLSDHTLVDNRFAIDTILIRPRISTMNAIISPNPLPEGLSYGPARIAEVMNWLREVRDRALIISIQVPGRPLIENMGIESFSFDSGSTDSLACSISFKEMRIAYVRSTVLTQVPKKPGGKPTSQVAAGMAPVKDSGTKPKTKLISLSQAGLDKLFSRDQQKAAFQALGGLLGLDEKKWEPKTE